MNDLGNQMISNIFKALASPTRVKIVQMLKKEPLCVCNIIDGLGTEQSNTSQHLNVLKNAGIVDFKKEGLKVIYNLKHSQVLDMINIAEEILDTQLEETKQSLKKE